MKQSAAAGGPPGSGQRPPGVKLALAWASVLAFACVVLWMGTPNFSASRSYVWLTRILRFFDPDVQFDTVIWLHHAIRKAMHVILYALLALLAFRASWLSFGNVIARVSITALFIAVGVALIDEGQQALHESRTGSPYDVLIDSAGALAAVGVAVFAMRTRLLRRRDRLEA